MLSAIPPAVLSALPAAVLSAPPPRPVFDDSFSVSTVELDDTLNSTVTVRQALHRDTTARRSYMSANGTLVGGVVEQIMRCDIAPVGWMIQAGGKQSAEPTTWKCTNRTVLSDPQYCQFGHFWTPLPANATYAGRELQDGRQCDRWNYWRRGEQYAEWASIAPRAEPVAIGKTWTADPRHHLWRILWRDYQPGWPPLSSFAATPGLKCPAASPPTSSRAQRPPPQSSWALGDRLSERLRSVR